MCSTQKRLVTFEFDDIWPAKDDLSNSKQNQKIQIVSTKSQAKFKKRHASPLIRGIQKHKPIVSRKKSPLGMNINREKISKSPTAFMKYQMRKISDISQVNSSTSLFKKNKSPIRNYTISGQFDRITYLENNQMSYCKLKTKLADRKSSHANLTQWNSSYMKTKYQTQASKQMGVNSTSIDLWETHDFKQKR